MKFFFELEVGLCRRNAVRQMLQNSKEKIMYWYPGSRVLLTEHKDWFESKFYFEANDLPDSAEADMRDWHNRMKQLENI